MKKDANKVPSKYVIFFYIVYTVSWLLLLYSSIIIMKNDNSYIMNFKNNVFPASYWLIGLGVIFFTFSLLLYVVKRYKMVINSYGIFLGVWSIVFFYHFLWGRSYYYRATYAVTDIFFVMIGISYFFSATFYIHKDIKLCLAFSASSFILSLFLFFWILSYSISNAWLFYMMNLFIIVPLIILTFNTMMLYYDKSTK